MLHLLPESAPQPQLHERPAAYAEAVSRLASIRHALRLVEPYGSGPASDADETVIAAAWEGADDARRRCFDRRSASLVEATAAGLEALLAERQHGREPSAEASQALVDEIRRELAAVSRVVLG